MSEPLAAREAPASYLVELDGQRVRSGYKQTEVGVIPEDWKVVNLGTVARSIHRGASPRPIDDPRWFDEASSIGWVRISDVTQSGRYLTETTQRLTQDGVRHSRYVPSGALIMSICATVGRPIETRIDTCIHDGFVLFDRPSIEQGFLYHVLKDLEPRWSSKGQTGSQMNLNTGLIKSTRISLPPTKAEQEAIAEALSDADALIESLEQLIAKKRHLKQGAMQELLTGKKRLPGFGGAWEVKRLEEITDCLDNLRVPLNESQRDQMRGDYPYCGANGVLDFVNDYVIDDDVILIAEDGGYFDEYAYRPIAYRMAGKCWVNNHAHILKAKVGHDQGYIFYSLVHKNILNYLASGTRAKLNKSEMWKIEVRMPLDFEEQTAIATILSDMDADIAVLAQQLAKARGIKRGMMQELLTGRIRLV